jgi:group I intron endonuclease
LLKERIEKKPARKQNPNRTRKTCVYQIKNTVNDKVYIGESFHGEYRFRQHLYDLRAKRHPNHKLQADFNKFGENVFEWSTIKECPEDKDILRLEERKAIQKFINEKKSLYNIK